MLVQIRDIKVQKKVTTVILERDIEDVDNKRLSMFFCFNCQNPIAQYTGTVMNIMPGAIPTDYPVLLHQCKHCKKTYTFQGVAYI